MREIKLIQNNVFIHPKYYTVNVKYGPVHITEYSPTSL